jgi:peptidoglycan/LPS O-acetylase OafA/YrhL
MLSIGLAHRLVNGLAAHVVVGSLLAIIMASGSHYVVEKPALRLRARLEAAIRGRRVTTGARVGAVSGAEVVPAP